MRLYLKALSWSLALLFFLSSTVWAGPPEIKAKAAVLIDATTGQVLFNKNMDKRYAPASTTKILTAILTLESGKMQDTVKVSLKAAHTPGSTMHLYAGQRITVEELLTGLLLRSGNDAAVALAEHIAGSVNDFIPLMNDKAKLLGALNSHFVNPHGLTAPGHYSTAYDLAWMARYALTMPQFAQIVRTKETTIEWLERSGRERDQNLRNTNKLLWMFDDADGVKTGTTGEAGQCLVSSATRGQQRLIAVVLNDSSRWYDSMQLLKFGFDAYDLYQFAESGDVVAVLPVENGLSSVIDAIAATDAAIVVDYPDYQYISVSVDLPETIKAPIYQGQKLGEILIFVKDKAVKSIDIVAAQAVEEHSFKRILVDQLFKTFRTLSRWGVL